MIRIPGKNGCLQLVGARADCGQLSGLVAIWALVFGLACRGPFREAPGNGS